jgi:hypothetical protein
MSHFRLSTVDACQGKVVEAWLYIHWQELFVQEVIHGTESFNSLDK